MHNKTMNDYLTSVKTLVDNIIAAGGSVDTEDILLYTLNGLPPSYQSFKTAIRTALHPISLDEFYSFLRSEEVNQTTDAIRDLSFANAQPTSDPALALVSTRGRGRTRFSNRARGRSSTTRPPRQPRFDGNCQICGKHGHSSFSCWHRGNMQFVPPTPTPNAALFVESETTPWFLDSGATAHLTPDPLPLQQPYSGKDQVLVGNGNLLPIHHVGNGLLPTPLRSDDQSYTSSRPMP
ncbi:5'-3' exoribonuclease 2 [Dendrobium catenatum]|uniref:5'-3' exoribonuclease 2 n=1 Tax=Dendrobium catenatum TaxID=906689 RepID=A0A2I0WZK2_9ASPA|nr:5'-3' exoribonuclease 2 [Dendrobium catenatum]